MRAIKPLSRDSCPDVMFLAKSKSPHSRMEDVRLKLGFESLCYEEAKGRAGGLALFWKKGVDLEVVSSDRYSIATLVYSDPPNSTWLLIVVHGPPNHSQ